MQVVTKDEFTVRRQQFVQRMKSGSVFVYPTDTIYGIGCNAMVDKAVERIRSIKSRYTRPFSVIVPSIDWIREHCEVPEGAEEWMEQLPGPVTLILKLKDAEMISSHVNNGLGTLGVRFPQHWFTDVVAELGYPLVTTSANHVGGNYMTSVEDLADDIQRDVDFIIYEGQKHGRPSRIVDFCVEEPTITER